MQSADMAQFLGESATASAAIAMVQRSSHGTAGHGALAPLRGDLGHKVLGSSAATAAAAAAAVAGLSYCSRTIDVNAKVATTQRRDTTSSNSWSW
jgi:hypothetical protein